MSSSAIPSSGELIRRALVAGDLTRAGELLGQALASAPDDPSLLAQKAMLLELLGQRDQAFATTLSALAIDPSETQAAAMAARWMLDRCEASAAATVAETCLAIKPDAVHVRRALASARLFLGEAAAARHHAEQAATRIPGDPAAASTVLMTCLYDDTLPAMERSQRHREVAAAIRPASCAVALSPAHGRRLRIGFYSADFRQHPVGRLIAPVLEQLDRERFEPFCYADLAHPDALTESLCQLPLRWCDVTGWSDEQVLSRMREDGLDVLVDLAGHSFGGRPRVLRGRAAPLQMAWLGYPYTSGLPEIDLLIGDVVTLPPGCEAQYSERLLRLPLGVFCLQSPEDLPPVAPLPMLTRGAPTLGSFNHLAKLSDRTVALWAQLLLRVPTARLVLCAIPLLEPATRELTLARFVRHGIDPARIELRPPQPPGDAFLRQYDDIDLALDPLPFSGGATTLDAMRQGVPVVTLPGDGFQARMSASILHQLRLPEFIARDEAHYETIVADWLGRPDDLASLRASMRRRFAGAAAADVDRYVRDFERLVLAETGR